MLVTCSVCGEERNSPEKCGKAQCKIDVQYHEQHLRTHQLLELTFGFAGGTSAGKTYYIVTLIAKLTRHARFIDEKLNLFLDSLDISFKLMESCRGDFLKLIDQINKGKMIATIPTADTSIVEPYQIEMTIGKDRRSKSSYRLTFLNSSGELYNNPYGGAKYFERPDGKRPDAMFVFVDPKEDSKLSVLIPEKFAPNKHPKDVQVVEILGEVRNKVEYSHKFQLPLAIIISKFDLLEQQEGVLIEQPYIEIKEIANKFNHNSIFSHTSRNIEKFLDKNSSTVNPKEILRQFNKVSYFAVAPIGNNQMPPIHLEPKGIYAPFFWVLDKLNIKIGEDHVN